MVAVLALLNYMLELLARKEREPGDDLMSWLMTEYVATGQLSRETAAMNGFIMVQAGHETTASMIALGSPGITPAPR
jgi:cytochrome P450